MKTHNDFEPQKKNHANLSRRQLLLGMGVGATALATGMMGCTAGGNPSQDREPNADDGTISLKEPTQTIDADVVVVGSGMGGMSAAVTAAEEGANVLLLEKQSVLGGGTNFAEGVFGMGSDLQKEAGVNGSLSDLLAIELEFQRYIVDYTLWDFVVKGAEENLAWLMDHGVKFVELGQGPYAGIRTQHIYEEHRGSTMIAKLEEAARSIGVEIRTDTPVTHLLMDGDAVVGVQAENGNDVLNVNAKAVILATGSAGSNNELFDGYTSRTSEKYMWCGAPGLDGDGIRMAGEAGMGKPYRLMAPLVGTTVEPLGVASQLAALAAMNPYALWVNQDGKRFMNEWLVRTAIYAPNAIESQHKAFSILDQALFDRLVEKGDPNVGWGYYVYKNEPLPDAPKELDQELSRESENVFKADSIADLADLLGIEPSALEETVADYNKLVDAKEDPALGKKADFLTDKIETGPFYGFRVKGAKVNMFGGIHINSNAEVVKEDATPIAGLYAAGVECGGFQGETYGITVPSSCQGISLATGRKSAQSAAAYAKK